MPFICTICENVAFEKYNQLRAHLMGKHREEKESWPAREDTEIAELPEGVRFVKAPVKRALLAEEERPAIKVELGELSSEAKHLHDLLLLHGVKQASVDVVVNLYDKLDLYKDPRNLANLLKQRLDRKEQYAIVPVLFELFPERKEEVTYIIPQIEGGAPWYGQPAMGGGYPYYPNRPGMAPGFPSFAGYPPMGEKSSLDKWIDYQITKETMGEKGGKERGVTPEVESRLERIENALEKVIVEKENEEKDSKAVSSLKGELTEIKSAFTKMSEEKERKALIQPLLDKIDLMERSHRDEMSRLSKEFESKKGKGEETDWLQNYMKERDSRHEDEVNRYREDLNRLTTEITKSREKEGSAYRQAWQDFVADKEKFEQASIKAKEELKSAGWTGRERDFEERVLDIVEHQAAPALIGEIQAGRKTLQDIAKKVGVGVESEAREQPPITDEEAAKISEVMSLEEEMRSLGKS